MANAAVSGHAGRMTQPMTAAGARPTMEPKSVPIDGDRPLTFRIAFCKGLDGEVLEFFCNEEL